MWPSNERDRQPHIRPATTLAQKERVISAPIAHNAKYEETARGHDGHIVPTSPLFQKVNISKSKNDRERTDNEADVENIAVSIIAEPDEEKIKKQGDDNKPAITGGFEYQNGQNLRYNRLFSRQNCSMPSRSSALLMEVRSYQCCATGRCSAGKRWPKVSSFCSDTSWSALEMIAHQEKLGKLLSKLNKYGFRHLI
jgi:hypothetical protein